MPNRTEARPAKAAPTNATGRLPLLRLFSTPLIDAVSGEETAHRVRKSLEEEEQIEQRNLLLSSRGRKSRLIKVEQTGQ